MWYAFDVSPSSPGGAPSDTPPEIERLLVDGFRRMPLDQKLCRVFSMNQMLRELEEARIRVTYGADLSDREVRLRVSVLWLGRDLVLRATGWDADVEGY